MAQSERASIADANVTDNDEITFLTTKDLKEMLKIGKDKAYALMHSKSFPSVQIGKTFCVSRASVIRWARANAGKQITI